MCDKAHKAIKDYTFKGPKYMLLEIEGVTCSGVLDQCTRIGVQAYLPDEIFPLVNALIEITLSNQRSNSIINPNTSSNRYCRFSQCAFTSYKTRTPFLSTSTRGITFNID